MKIFLKLLIRAVAIIFILNTSGAAFAYRVEIISADSGEPAYSMKVNSEATFIVRAYANEEMGVPSDQQLPIEKIFWQFDYTMLEKVSSNKETIKLRALRKGKTNLIVTSIVENYPFTTSVELTIEQR